MSEALHELTNIIHRDIHSLKASVRLEENLSDFDGHFPVQKVLPGVMQLDLIQYLAEDWAGQRLCMISIPQLKFLHPLKPRDEIQISMEFNKTKNGYKVGFSFGLQKDEKRFVVCRGKVQFSLR